MGWFYFMSIRCSTKWAAQQIAYRYSGQTFVFANQQGGWQEETVCRFGTEVDQDVAEDDGGSWVDIVPSQITSSGLADPKECDRATQFCNIMYGMLRNEKHFDYAVAGVETQQFRNLKELKEELAEWPDKVEGDVWIIYRMHGLVVSKAILQEFPEAAKQFQEFSPTHLWIPKKPENCEED